MKHVIPFLALIVFFQCSPKSTNPDYTSAIDSTRSALLVVKNQTDIPGLAVAIMVDGEMIYSEGFGVSDIENNISVDPASTLFRIGSVSKSMSSIAMGILHEEGKLDFKENINAYVPDFPQKKYPVTVEQVAGHIAGIRHYRGDEMFSDKYYATVDEGLEIFKDDSLLFEPGTDYRYSSYGWNLLSAIVESASGEEFLDFMKMRVFEPNNLSNTRADYANQDIPNRTSFYYLSGSEISVAPYVDNSYKWAGGGFIASCEDLTKFGQTMLDPEVISKETVSLLTKPLAINDTTSTNYGIGWRSGKTDEGYSWFGHSGGSIGGITQLVIYPDTQVIVGITSNSSDVNYNGVQHEIARWFSEAKD